MSAIPSGLDSPSACLGNGNSNRLVSLWDMLRFLAHDFFRSFDRLEEQIGYYKNLVYRGTLNENELPTKVNCNRMAQALQESKRVCQKMRLRGAMQEIGQFEQRLGSEFPPSYRYAIDGMESIRASVRVQLRERILIIVDPLRSEYFYKDALFGEVVHSAFQRAAKDIKSAGTCYAIEEPNACMYHLMRVLEHGLLALGKRVGIKKLKALSLATWGSINKEIQDKIDKLKAFKRDPFSVTRLAQYSQILKDYQFLQCAWRDVVMHNRKDFSSHRAIETLTYVRTFMQTLAEMGIRGRKL